jgi:hypothetical protein
MSADNNDTSLAEFLRQEWKILLTIKPRLNDVHRVRQRAESGYEMQIVCNPQ